MNDPPRIRTLVVEDSPTDALLLREALTDLPHAEFAITHAERLQDALACLADAEFDVVLLDLGLPDSQGLDTLVRLRGQQSEVPVVVLTGLDDQAVGIRALQAGAQDYLVKAHLQPSLLGRSLRYAIERHQAAQALRRSEVELREAQRIAHLGRWTWEVATDSVTWSEEIYRTFGLDPTLAPPPVAEQGKLFSAESWALLRAALEEVAKDGTPFELDLELARTDLRAGGWIVARGEPWRGGNGQVAGLRGTIQDISERKRAEAEKARLATAIEQAAETVVITGIDGNIQYVNPAFTRVTGYSCEEVLGKNPRLLRSGRQDSKFYQQMWGTILAGTVWRGEIVNRRKDGSLFEEEMTIAPVRGADSKITNFIAIKQDITERKRAEAENLRLITSMEQCWDTVIITDPDGIIQYVNPRFCEVSGYSREEAVGSNPRLLKSGKHPPEFFEGFWKSIQAGHTWHGEIVNRRKDGTLYTDELHVAPVRDANGKITHFISNQSDVTERKRAEAALLRSQRVLAQAEQLAHVGAWESRIVADEQLDDFPLHWSDETYRIFGYAAGAVEASHRLFLEHVHPEDRKRVRDALSRAIADRTPYSVEHRVRRGDGSERTLVEHAEIVVDETGRPERVIGAVADITERKQAEEEVRKLNQELEARVKKRTAELEAAITELEAFTSSVAHDLRSPLRHMAGFSQILVEEYGPELNVEARQYLERIRSGAIRMGKLVDDLLDLSRVGRRTMNWQAINLEELVAEVRRELEGETQGRQIEWRIGKLPPAFCDRVLLKQAFYNLLSNAVKYTRPRNPAVIELGCCENGGANPIYVRDNGVGFNMEHAAKLFGIFQRLHREEEFEGTGVGLAVVQRVIHRHGGRVWAEAEPGRGASFYFTLRPPASALQTPN